MTENGNQILSNKDVLAKKEKHEDLVSLNPTQRKIIEFR